MEEDIWNRTRSYDTSIKQEPDLQDLNEINNMLKTSLTEIIGIVKTNNKNIGDHNSIIKDHQGSIKSILRTLDIHNKIQKYVQDHLKILYVWNLVISFILIIEMYKKL